MALSRSRFCRSGRLAVTCAPMKSLSGMLIRP
jgi:hypothetical protein